MIHKILHRLYMGIVTIGCTMLWTLSGCDNDTLDSFLQFSDDNLLLRAAGDTVVIDVTAGSGWKAESMADWCTVEEKQGEAEEKLIIRVSPSDDIYERGTAVKVTCGDNVIRLSVRQEPMVFEERKVYDHSFEIRCTHIEINCFPRRRNPCGRTHTETLW